MPFEDDKPKETENSPFEAPSEKVVVAPIGCEKIQYSRGFYGKVVKENRRG